MDVSVFLLKAIGEYIRLLYRSFNPRPLRDVSGEVVLITGAGHGIGREVALQLGKLGAIVICVDKNIENNQSTGAKIRSEGGYSWCYQCDVSNKEAVREMAARVRRDVGDVNILINNAGIMVTKQFLLQTEAEIESTVNVRLLVDDILSVTECWCSGQPDGSDLDTEGVPACHDQHGPRQHHLHVWPPRACRGS